MSNKRDVNKYVNDILKGKKVACKENIQACKRYVEDLKNPAYTFKQKEADEIIEIIENTIVLLEGEDINGDSFRHTPLLLQPWQKFVIYNLFGFFKKGTKIRRFEEAFVFIPKKNGKTPFAGALAWAFAYKYSKSASKVLLTSNSLQQSLYSFNFIKENIEEMGISNDFRIRDNNNEHSIIGKIEDGDGEINIRAFAGNPDNKDGLKANFVIADEIHEYKDPNQYIIYQKSMKNYRNKLMLAITTAGDDPTSFCAKRLETCQKILSGEISREEYFVFITKADVVDGSVDFMNPIEHQKANPSYNKIVMGEDLLKSAELARLETQMRKSFFAKELNIYTDSIKTYFDIETFISSDECYNWSLEELAKLPIVWYGGVDLSAIKDLTSCVLYGTYKDVDIIIPHCFFPVTRAKEKAEEDNIELFAWQEDGWLTMCNSNTIDHNDVVHWFIKMRKKGFKIKETRYDVRFSEEFAEDMIRSKFKIVNQPQLYVKTTVGFNRIDKMSEEKKLYYCSSEAFEYCVRNVFVVDRPGGFKQFSKIPDQPNKRIDIFAAAVFAATGMMETKSKQSKVSRAIGSAQGDSQKVNLSKAR